MTPKSWYKIAAAKHDDGEDGGHAEILIYDEIGRDWFGEGIAAEDLVKELAALDVATLDVRINSMGGQVFEGLAIFNALDRHPATVTAHVDGMAASIASVIALAGEKVNIAENAFMMIHNPHGFSMGDANAMRKMADILDTLAGSLAETYVAKTGKSSKVIRGMMDEETWFNAEEALEAGLVDEVTSKMEIAAKFDISKFHNVRPDVLERVAEAVRPMGLVKPAAKADDFAALKSELAALKAETARVEAATAALGDEGPDPDLVQLAAESEATLARTRL